MGLWESVIIVTVFSVVVIALDEWMHARRRRKKAQQQGSGRTH
jgi:hypothetical protein